MGDVDNCWMKQFVAENRGDCLDIYGMHYYPKHREIFDALKFELSLIGDRPFWATEPHWDAKDGENDMLDYAETAINGILKPFSIAKAFNLSTICICFLGVIFPSLKFSSLSIPNTSIIIFFSFI